MNQMFECHVVFNPKDKIEVAEAALKYDFSMSFITGDEDLGDVKLLYLTKRSDNFQTIHNDMYTLIYGVDPEPVRYKIEVTLIDVLHKERVQTGEPIYLHDREDSKD